MSFKLTTDKELMRKLIAARLAPFTGKVNDSVARDQIIAELTHSIEPDIAHSFTIEPSDDSQAMTFTYVSGVMECSVTVTEADVAKSSEENETRFRLIHHNAGDMVDLLVVAAENLPATDVGNADSVVRAAQAKFQEGFTLLESLLAK